jgi:hopanoid biosynthesis associated RND transporter like protein HpnN
MNPSHPSSTSLLGAWVRFVQRSAPVVAAITLLVVVAVAVYASGHLSVDTDSSDMLSKDLPWRRAGAELDRLFPQQSESLAVVIDADTPEHAETAQRELVDSLRAHPEQFNDVFAIDTEPFFRRNGLLYLDEPELRKVADALTQAQPFLGTLARDPSLHGLFTLLQRALTNGGAQDFDLTPALTQIADSTAAATEGRDHPLSWRTLTASGMPEQNSTRRFIEVNPKLDYSQILPAAAAIDEVRTIVREHDFDALHGVRVRLTGTVALEHEELLSAGKGAVLAFAVGMALVVILLFFALRSWRLVVAALVALICGLLLTAGFAAATIGHLNMISVAFGVLYIGLGIDYALYLCMQYRELLGSGWCTSEALPRAAAEVGGFMAVCAATTSLGFFAFIPTDFTGIAELGLISGVGMFISLGVSLTLLPALIALLSPRKTPSTPAAARTESGFAAWLTEAPYRHARKLWAAAALASGVSLLLLPRASFDYDPLDLRDPHSESVSTYRDLLADPDVPTLTLSAIAGSADEARSIAARVAKLPLVRQAMTVSDFVPDNQPAKLAILEDLNFTLGPDLGGAPPEQYRGNDGSDLQALQSLSAALAQLPAPSAAQTRLLSELNRFSHHYQEADGVGRAALLSRLRAALLGTLPSMLADLHEALQASAVSEKNLPPDLVQRWISADGHYRIDIWPREVLNNNPAIQRFVEQVRTIVPNAAGAPVDFLESGRAVVSAFQHAFAYSLIAITFLLLVLLRSFADMLLVLIPLTLAGLLTVAGSVLFRVPFNFANVIALPLILGVGVDYGVYIVQRARAAAGSDVNLLRTSTARAVLFGALITVANFGNLALSSHPGTRSMGMLLTVGLGMTLICTLVLLPSLLARRYGAPHIDTD